MVVMDPLLDYCYGFIYSNFLLLINPRPYSCQVRSPRSIYSLSLAVSFILIIFVHCPFHWLQETFSGCAFCLVGSSFCKTSKSLASFAFKLCS